MDSAALLADQQPLQRELFSPPVAAPWTERRLVAACVALGVDPLAASPQERALMIEAESERSTVMPLVQRMRQQLRAGADPLGELFQQVRPAALRRAAGAVYTPLPLVEQMLDKVSQWAVPARVVDPGAGSGRFVLAAARRWPSAGLVAVEPDPLAALMLRAHSAALGLSPRVDVRTDDFRQVSLPAHGGVTAYIGNPPYVRHHQIGADWKRWYTQACAQYGVKASALAGLHLHFCVRTLQLARPGDLGCFVMAAEWLDVNYGSALRQLLTGPLGLRELEILDATAEVFPGTASTAVIVGFRVGDKTQTVAVTRRTGLADPQPPVRQAWSPEALSARPRWSSLVWPAPLQEVQGHRLGDLFRVHRGQVTGANAVWIPGSDAPALPQRLLLPRSLWVQT